MTQQPAYAEFTDKEILELAENLAAELKTLVTGKPLKAIMEALILVMSEVIAMGLEERCSGEGITPDPRDKRVAAMTSDIFHDIKMALAFELFHHLAIHIPPGPGDTVN